MPSDDSIENKERTPAEEGVEYRATIRFPRKDYEFMQKLINEGEYTNITEVVRDAVKRFRLEWSDMTAVQSFMPMSPGMGTRMMPRMRRMMEYMSEYERRRKAKE